MTCLVCQGYNAEDVKPRYFQDTLNGQIVPLISDEETLVFLYEEEQEAYEQAKRGKPWTGIFKPLFRALGMGKDDEEVQTEQVVEVKPKKELESKKIAKRKTNRGLFEPL